jgi:hypothetical protein
VSSSPPLSELNHQELTDAGWEKRSMLSSERSDEAAELYRAMGLEVTVRRVRAEEMGANCGPCCKQACSEFLVLYTRQAGGRQP